MVLETHSTIGLLKSDQCCPYSTSSSNAKTYNIYAGETPPPEIGYAGEKYGVPNLCTGP